MADVPHVWEWFDFEFTHWGIPWRDKSAQYRLEGLESQGWTLYCCVAAYGLILRRPVIRSSSFGAGTPAILHGTESVIPSGEYRSACNTHGKSPCPECDSLFGRLRPDNVIQQCLDAQKKLVLDAQALFWLINNALRDARHSARCDPTGHFFPTGRGACVCGDAMQVSFNTDVVVRSTKEKP